MSQTDPAADRTLVCLHFLGGSARHWQEVADRLDVRVLAVDLPGFGDAAGVRGHSVSEMADHAADAVRAAAPGRWTLAGHSMGGKVACVLARRAEDGEPGLGGLDSVVLLAASPPGPEPMDARMRDEMRGWFAGGPERSRDEAVGFVAANVGAALPPDVEARTVDDVLRCDRDAWTDWLDHGSREDWTARVGLLRTPALIVSGSADAALGPDAQRALVAPSFADARLVTLQGAGHLLPAERPDLVARLLAGDLAGLVPEPAGPAIGPAYRALLASDRVSVRTREAQLARARPDDPGYAPRAMSVAQLATLRAVVDRLVPQPGDAGQPRIDLAARLDGQLADGPGDGWRLVGMPPDAGACRSGLDTLDACAGGPGFARLAAAAQDDLLGRAAAGTLEAAVPGATDPAADASVPREVPGEPGRADPGPASGRLDATQLRLWFEETRSAATRVYVAHPATLARMGYSGIGYGGDTARLGGFVALGIGAREPWEPIAASVAPPPTPPLDATSPPAGTPS